MSCTSVCFSVVHTNGRSHVTIARGYTTLCDVAGCTKARLGRTSVAAHGPRFSIVQYRRFQVCYSSSVVGNHLNFGQTRAQRPRYVFPRGEPHLHPLHPSRTESITHDVYCLCFAKSHRGPLSFSLARTGDRNRAERYSRASSL